MKKHSLSLLLTFIILTLFTGCHNLSGSTATLPSPENVAASDGFCCVVSGRVSTELDAAAMPASAARQVFPSGGSAASVRTALPSLNLTGEVTITAKFYDTTAGIPDVTSTYDTENKTFSVPLTKTGSWIIEASNSTYSGSTTVEITRDTLVKNGITLKMKPDLSTLSGTGTISLPVSIEDGTGIKTIAMTFTDSLSTVHTPDITLISNSTTGTLNETGVAAGTYSATIRAYDTAGALVFQCTESLLVLPGETTNNWVISSADVTASPYLSLNEAGVVQFKITKACLENFARTSYYAAPYGDDTEGDGSQGNPFLTLKKAADTIMLYNDGVSEYTIFIEDDITYSSAADAFSISLPEGYTKDLKVKLTSDSTTACTVNANGLTNVLKVINESAKKCILTVENVVLSSGNGSSGSGIYISGKDSNITATKLILNSGVEISNSLNTYTMSGIGITVFNGSFEMNDGSKITGSDYSLSYNLFMGGGGLYLLGSEAIINGGEISGFNFSTTNITGQGTAIYASQSNVIMNGGRITDNTISGSASSSGTIIYLLKSNYIMNGGTISNNSITGIGNASGGAFYISDADSSVTLNSGNISNNAVKGSGSKGGAIYHNGGTLTINGGSFYNNSAENGGALYSTLSTNATELIVSGGYFFANTATKGAGMYLASSAGSATLKGAPVFSPADDIYLEKPAGGSIKPLNIDGALLKPYNADYVATITPGEYPSGTDMSGAQVLSGDFSSNTAKFAIASNTADPDARYTISSLNGTIYNSALGILIEDISTQPSSGSTVLLTQSSSLTKLSSLVNEGVSFEGSTVKLYDNLEMPADYVSIGTETCPFMGTFDGNNKTITYITKPVFSYIQNATVKDLTVGKSGAGESFEGSYDYVSPCISHMLANCTVSGVTNNVSIDIAGKEYNNSTAGIVAFIGKNQNETLNVLIENCTNYGNIKISGADGLYAAGIMGRSPNYVVTGIQIKDCVNIGTISSLGTSGGAGGIAGSFYTSASTTSLLIDSCINKGEVYASYYLGGIVAQTNYPVIKNCTNKASLYLKADNANYGNAGGIVGYIDAVGTVFSLVNCVNSGDITIQSAAKETRVGGILGYQYGKENYDAHYCVFTGKIQVEDGVTLKETDYVGSITGYDKSTYSSVSYQHHNFYIEQNLSGSPLPAMGKCGNGTGWTNFAFTIDSTTYEVDGTHVGNKLNGLVNSDSSLKKWTTSGKPELIYQ